MRRAVVRFAYVFRSALRGLRSNPVTSTVAVATIGVSLVLAGTFFLLVRNMEELLDEFGDDLHVTVYLADGVSADRQRELARIAITLGGCPSPLSPSMTAKPGPSCTTRMSGAGFISPLSMLRTYQGNMRVPCECTLRRSVST